MRYFLSATFSSALLVFSLSSVTSFAGDCNHTVMGGGCTSEVGAGVSPHMHSQSQSTVGEKTKAGGSPVAKATTPPKNVGASNSANQKPKN